MRLWRERDGVVEWAGPNLPTWWFIRVLRLLRWLCRRHAPSRPIDRLGQWSICLRCGDWIEP